MWIALAADEGRALPRRPSLRTIAPARGVIKRSLQPAKRLSLASRSEARLVGRRVTIPYSEYIKDDETGLTVEGRVEAAVSGQCMVQLPHEMVSFPTHKVRRWLLPDVDQIDALLSAL